MSQDFFEYHIETMKEKYPTFGKYQNYHIFTLLCIKYFFYSESGTSFDQDVIEEFLTDGANDGGIDAIFNDPTSEGNDLIIVQSKFYENTILGTDNVAGELYKINETLKKLQSNKISEFNDKLVTAYRNATSQMEENANIRIVFFTSYQPKNKRERNKLDKSMRDYFGKYDLEMNLRYYVRQKAVDTGIEKTIHKEPENFWYKNNGILIICDDYKIDGKEIKLWNFSIVNGGQTTNRIGKLDIEKDFYLQCKVVKSKGNTTQMKDKFALEIAEATNSQKPVKKADLKANTPEQIRLKERLNRCQVYYITKKGDKTPKQYSEPYQTATLEQVGKLGLAAILQMPGSARSNSQRMYNDEYYYSIFGEDAKEGVIADLLKMSYYYDKFVKVYIKDKGYDEKTVLPMMKNGRTFQYACVTFLCKINYGVFAYDTIAGMLNNVDDLKIAIRNMGNIEKLISVKLQDEEKIFMEIFSVIGDEVLGYCFDSALYKAEEEQRTLAPSDYLKSDINYYKDVIKRLWNRYKQNNSLRENIDLICGNNLN